MDGARYLALLSVKDPTLAQAWFDGVIAKSGAKTTTETYNGATLTISTEPNKPKAAFAVLDGKVAAIGDVTSVKAAVDTKGNSGFASEPGPKAALGARRRRSRRLRLRRPEGPGRLVDDLSKTVSPDAGKAAEVALTGPLAKAIPAWIAYWLSFESDALVMEAAAPKPETSLGPDPEPHVDRSWSTCRPVRSSCRSATTSARRSSRCSRCTGRIRPSRRC